MKDNQGCCGHPSICETSRRDGRPARCKAREDWIKAQRKNETRAERRARIKREALAQQARERAMGLDLGRTR